MGLRAVVVAGSAGGGSRGCGCRADAAQAVAAGVSACSSQGKRLRL
jgi:hypothetical protein